MGRLIVPDKTLVKHDSGLFLPMTYTEKQELYFMKNYDMIAHYLADPIDKNHRIYVEDCSVDHSGISKPTISPISKSRKIAESSEVKNPSDGTLIDPRKVQKKISPKKRCRFCGKTMPEVKFKKDAHAISELVGNKRIFLRNECDDCNELFGRLYEDAFSAYLGAARTVSQTEGKNGVPSYKDNNETIRIDVGRERIVIQEAYKQENIDFYEDHADLHLKKEPYSPLAAYKALVVMALSIMPYDEFKCFRETAEWLLEEDILISKYNMSCYASKVIERFIAGVKPLPVQAWLFRRKSPFLSPRYDYSAPYCQFILEFDNYSFQIVVPNIQKDAVLWRKSVDILPFPASFDVFPKLRENRTTAVAIRDFSNAEKVRDEPAELSLQFESRKELEGALGTVAEMAEKEGVKPLKPKPIHSLGEKES